MEPAPHMDIAVGQAATSECDPSKRVLYVLDQYPSTSETFIANEIAELRRRGIFIEVIALARPAELVSHDYAEREQSATTYVSDLGGMRRVWLALQTLWSPLRTARALLEARQRSPGQGWSAKRSLPLAGLMANSRAQHVHTHFASVAATHAVPAAHISGKSITLTTHGYDVLRSPIAGLGALINATDGCIAVTTHTRDILISQQGARPELVSPITCGVDTRFFVATPPPHSSPPRVLTVARLSREKNLILAIQVAQALVERGISFQWNIIGEGPEREGLEALIRECSLTQHIALLGAKSAHDVREALAACDVFVLTSTSEAAGTVLIEAMACARPVVAPKVGGLAEIVRSGITGLIVESGDVSAFANALEELLIKPAARAEMGAAGRTHVIKNLSLVRQVDQLLIAWEQATNRHHHRVSETT